MVWELVSRNTRVAASDYVIPIGKETIQDRNGQLSVLAEALCLTSC